MFVPGGVKVMGKVQFVFRGAGTHRASGRGTLALAVTIGLLALLAACAPGAMAVPVEVTGPFRINSFSVIPNPGTPASPATVTTTFDIYGDPATRPLNPQVTWPSGTSINPAAPNMCLLVVVWLADGLCPPDSAVGFAGIRTFRNLFPSYPPTYYRGVIYHLPDIPGQPMRLAFMLKGSTGFVNKLLVIDSVKQNGSRWTHSLSAFNNANLQPNMFDTRPVLSELIRSIMFRLDARLSNGATFVTNPPTCVPPWTSDAIVYRLGDPVPQVATHTFAPPPSSCPPTVRMSVNANTTQAAAHPEVDIGLDFSGPDVQGVSLKLPDGFGISSALPANTICSPTAPNAVDCPTVGSASVTATVGNNQVTGTGTLLLTPRPTTNDGGGLAVTVWLPGVSSFSTLGALRFQNNARNEQLEFASIPSSIGGTPIHVSRISLHLNGTTGAPGYPFVTNQSNCTLASPGNEFSGTATFAGNATLAIAPVTHAVTGCAIVPFEPAASHTFTSQTAGTTSGLRSFVLVPPGTVTQSHSSMSAMRFVLPSAYLDNYTSYGQTSDRCPASSAPTAGSVFDVSACQGIPNAIIGNMLILTPWRSEALGATVYLIDKTPTPWLGVMISGHGIEMPLLATTKRVQADPLCDEPTSPTGECAKNFVIDFTTMPDFQIAQARLNLDNPPRGAGGSISGNLFAVASTGDPSCVSPSEAKSILTPYASPAVPVQRVQNFSISGC